MVIGFEDHELLCFLENEYIEAGYLNSGARSLDTLLESGFTQREIDTLLENHTIQKRKGEELSYELPVPKRHALLSKHSLCSRWLEKAGAEAINSIQAETRIVSLVEESVHNAKQITVDTLKRKGDESKPNKMDVSCPLSVGQVIQMEYDLPRKMGWIGYSYSCVQPKKTAVGAFMVTDIYCNLLVNPPINMIEVQSLSKQFNKIHSDSRTMQLFEDVILKRIKEPHIPLNKQIQLADDLSNKHSNPLGVDREREK